nr:Gag-Pol polyprotein [Tanacetum cinerariifolium]
MKNSLIHLVFIPEFITLIAEVVAPKPIESTGSPSSTTFDQDAPSLSNSQTTPDTQSLVISNDVEEENHNLDIVYMNNNPFFGIPIPKNDHESSFLDVIPTVVHTAALNSEHVTKWTKDHPLDNIIIEPKNYKDALTKACWIEAMQEELNEFKCLEVWELVPRPDKLMEKGLIIAALRDELRKLKEKSLVDNAVTTHIIAPEILKIDVEPIAPRLLNNSTVHSD